MFVFGDDAIEDFLFKKGGEQSRREVRRREEETRFLRPCQAVIRSVLEKL